MAKLFASMQVNVLKETSDWLVALLSTKVVWSSATMVSGEQCVMTSSIARTVLLPVDSWNMV